MNNKSTSEKKFQFKEDAEMEIKEDAEMENLLTGISTKINTILEKLSEALQGDRVYSLNTLAHVVLPGFLGSICALLISYGFVQLADPQELTPDDLTIGKSISYVFVATTVASVVTGFVVGIPNSAEKRIRTWLSCVALSISLPTGLTLLAQSQQALNAQIDKNQKYAEHLAQIQIAYNDPAYKKPQVNLSLDTTLMLQKNAQISDDVKTESFLSTISLINSNRDVLENPKIASKYFAAYKDSLKYSEVLTAEGLRFPESLSMLTLQNENYVALKTSEQNAFKNSLGIWAAHIDHLTNQQFAF